MEDPLCFWTGNVDDILIFIQKSFIEYVLQKLNSFHQNIAFTFELEKNNIKSLLDVLNIWNHNAFVSFALYIEGSDYIEGINLAN